MSVIDLTPVLEQLAAMRAELADVRAALDEARREIVPRPEAARAINVSPRQLRKLVAAGRIVAQPSGIAREELKRFARTPQSPLPQVVSKARRERSASEEADRGRAMLKALHRKRGAK